MAEDKEVRILVAEESKMVRNRLTSSLAELGINCVRQADTGFNALVSFHEFQPDVVVLDRSMPGADGIQVLTRIKARSRGTVVLMFSHLVDKLFVQRCEELGAAACFRNPEDFNELLTFIQMAPRTATS